MYSDTKKLMLKDSRKCKERPFSYLVADDWNKLPIHSECSFNEDSVLDVIITYSITRLCNIIIILAELLIVRFSSTGKMRLLLLLHI